MATKTDTLYHDYKLILMSLNERPVGELVAVKDFSYSPALVEIGELTFNLPRTYTDDTGNVQTTPLYDELEADMLVEVDGGEYYYINTCVENDTADNTQKQIHAYSREYELALKSFNDYEVETERLLYFDYPADGVGYPWKDKDDIPIEVREYMTSSLDSEGVPFGLFNTVEKITTWKFKRGADGYPILPDAVKTEAREISTSETNMLELMKIVQEAWNIIFEYDTKKREIGIVPADLFLRKPNGVLSDENFITGLNKEMKREEIKTRLFMYNSEGTGVIAERSAHGNTYMENYDHFKNDDYMSKGLQGAIDTYMTNLEARERETEAAWTVLKGLYAEEKVIANKIDDWETDLIDPLTRYDHYQSILNGFYLDGAEIAKPRPLEPLEKAAMDSASKEVEKLKQNIDFATKKELSILEESIEAQLVVLRGIQQKSLMSNVFKAEELLKGLEEGSLIREMEPYIRDATHQSDSIKAVDSLHKLGRELLKKISKPRLQFSIDVVDFLAKTDLDEFDFMGTLGQVLRVENHRLNFLEHVVLLKYTHTPESGGLTLEFSNQLELKNDTTFLAELISKSSSISSKVDFKSSFWSGGGIVGAQESGTHREIIAERIYTNRLVADEIEASEIRADQIYVTELEAKTIVADSILTGDLVANTALVKHLNANYAAIGRMDAAEATIGDLSVDTADIRSLVVDIQQAGYITAEYITAENINAAFVGATKLTADAIDVNFANIVLEKVETSFVDDAMIAALNVRDGYIKELTVQHGNIKSIDASTITVGTLVADQIAIRNPENPEESLIWGINNISGEIEQAKGNTIGGHVITKDTINADHLTVNSVIAGKIAANAVTADKIHSESILARHLTTSSFTAINAQIANLDAGVLTSGSIDATQIAINNLNASNITTGTLKGINDIVNIDLKTGYFNFGDSFVHNKDGFQIRVGSTNIEDYVEDRMIHRIDTFPAQLSIQTNSDGQQLGNTKLSVDIAVFKGFDRVAATVTGVYLSDAAGEPIVSGVTEIPAVQPTVSKDGKIGVTVTPQAILGSETGFLHFTTRTTKPDKTYLHKVGWTKVRNGEDSFSVVVNSTGGNAFKNDVGEKRLTATVYRGSLDITSSILQSRFLWQKSSSDAEKDEAWNITAALPENRKSYIDITSDDVDSSAVFKCLVNVR